jgi:hypothetical protein
MVEFQWEEFGAEGMALQLGDAVNGIEGRGVVEGSTADDGDDGGAMERREMEDGVIEAMCRPLSQPKRILS